MDPGIGFGKTRGAQPGADPAPARARRPRTCRSSWGRRASPSSASWSNRRRSTGHPGRTLPVVATGTQAAVAAAVLNGAHIVRVHDVAATVATVNVIDAILDS
ncbi:MAG: hypothetical protein MZU91_07625 [Desulfosudis oleivorans]|nr:hypothetical protein [Desulfosudis oleivorans]